MIAGFFYRAHEGPRVRRRGVIGRFQRLDYLILERAPFRAIVVWAVDCVRPRCHILKAFSIAEQAFSLVAGTRVWHWDYLAGLVAEIQEVSLDLICYLDGVELHIPTRCAIEQVDDVVVARWVERGFVTGIACKRVEVEIFASELVWGIVFNEDVFQRGSSRTYLMLNDFVVRHVKHEGRFGGIYGLACCGGHLIP